MNQYLTMLALTAIMDVGWVLYQSQPDGLYSKLIKGNLTTIRITLIWLLLLVFQVALLYLLTEHRQEHRLIMGTLQGFTVYSVFNLTSKVIFPDSSWPWHVAVKDIIWGAVLYGTVAHMIPLSSQNFDAAITHPASLI